MMTWAWKCRACGYEFTNPVFRFIQQCPDCRVEYRLLARAYGQPEIGQMPIYSLLDEDFTNDKTIHSVLFAINTRATKIECYNQEFYDFINEKFSQELTAKDTLLTMASQESIE